MELDGMELEPSLYRQAMGYSVNRELFESYMRERLEQEYVDTLRTLLDSSTTGSPVAPNSTTRIKRRAATALSVESKRVRQNGQRPLEPLHTLNSHAVHGGPSPLLSAQADAYPMEQ
uniref:Uncharacterized protein n=1 Tax=Calcidiscus leptoporus TaxID=127549 RepID=A0A7S0J9E7_9EUKA|mmetsp:Transcript_4633/g.10509  ORF Transcript_4633/g.10509 Transcript_4633/m.10509 type:complete len:117 (+) Transcript_4633:117-467(+)